ncbi:hypothetical protein LEMA_P084830.1 [Plenodomus lingam JN3]|uniref:Aminotransferase class V domain-containing protein n=1 Tax=Leptosphaeria maculans (strain JN3 / isolate v23.1.3 / race Av1-4-5-6-7-8) TaxID=985895 RepID=E5A6J9_LEPMJ|nr:hypothetical protein LEMA_P084830.1 [Plenodomus lingam JN3]CBX99244.1 hypothetical protein LEMA_P084830.1 [Plenodomus lingam JN3]
MTEAAIFDARTSDGVKFGRELRKKEFLFDEGWVNLNHVDDPIISSILITNTSEATIRASDPHALSTFSPKQHPYSSPHPSINDNPHHPGSFGTYPSPIRTVLRSYQDAAEARPDHFIRYLYPPLLTASRAALSTLLNVPASTLVFVPNATTGINTVLRNLTYSPGDHILYFDTIYGACEKTVAYITETTAAESVKIKYTYPVEDEWLVGELRRVVGEVESSGGKVKVAVFDTVVSMPGVRMPFERLVEVCRELGVLSCVDGAHGVGHIDLDLGALGADFFVSNCHKWLHVPRGCAVFHVPTKNHHLIRTTLPTSHAFIPKSSSHNIPSPLPSPPSLSTTTNTPPPTSSTSSTTSPFTLAFDFVGTIDNAPYLCVPTALTYRTQHLGGEQKIRTYCSTLALAVLHGECAVAARCGRREAANCGDGGGER